MSLFTLLRSLAASSALALAATAASADEVRVAVASNFAVAATEIGQAFEAAGNDEVLLVPGSTGKHFAQIRNGAPLDVLLAANVEHPRRLEDEGQGIVGTRFTYALGRLVLWSPQARLVDADGGILARGTFRHLAIANPRLAPYGVAAREVLTALELWDRLSPRIVRGENIAQALHFVVSGNAELGFIARSQLTTERRTQGSFWEVPTTLHAPIEQQAVLVRDGRAARDFLAFLADDAALEIIRSHGYEVP